MSQQRGEAEKRGGGGAGGTLTAETTEEEEEVLGFKLALCRWPPTPSTEEEEEEEEKELRTWDVEKRKDVKRTYLHP